MRKRIIETETKTASSRNGSTGSWIELSLDTIVGEKNKMFKMSLPKFILKMSIVIYKAISETAHVAKGK